MISFLEGNIASKGLDNVVLDVNGVGYLLYMATSSIASLPAQGERVRVLSYMSVTDSGISLYGFLNDDERDLFEALIGVNGVGPKMALSALSAYPVETLKSVIASQDAKSLTNISGVGKKIASRIVLELKDAFELTEGAVIAESNLALDGSIAAVSEALASMGFTANEISCALEGAEVGADESYILQYALRRLA